ncbi:MAG: hypothetical protein ACRDLQ_07650 [Solirubrobacterales bacterium]
MRTEQTLERLRALLAREGEAIAPALAAPGAEEVIGPLASACAAGRDEAPELALVLESVLEGYLLHYGRARLVDTDDEDLRLLSGDHLYALGLSRLARLGDLGAVAALADLITLCARAHADAGANGTPGGGPAALWLLTALAVGGGRWPEYEPLLEAARAGRADPQELLSEGRRRAARLGVELEAQAALIAFDRAVADRPHA